MIILLYANRHHILTADHHAAYRQQADFLYHTHIDVPGCRAIISEDKIYIFLPDRDEHTILRDGEWITKDQAQLLNPNAVIYFLSQREEKLTSLYREKEDIITNLDYLNTDTFQEKKQLIQLLNISKDKIRPLDQSYRVIKSVDEIKKIQKAQQITLEAIGYATQDIQAGMYEYEIAAKLSYYYASHGYEHSFDPIIASGENACTLHYTSNRAQLQWWNLLLIDTGAYVDGYCGDCSRTIIIWSQWNDEKNIYLTIVQHVHDDCISYTRPGITMKDLHDYAIQQFKSYFTIHHLTRKDEYFPHGIWHSIGLDVHDPLPKNLPLQEGMCITIEPGLYLPEQGIGIRWENIVVITKEWCKLMI